MVGSENQNEEIGDNFVLKPQRREFIALLVAEFNTKYMVTDISKAVRRSL